MIYNCKTKIFLAFIVFTLLALSLMSSIVHAHEGHDHEIEPDFTVDTDPHIAKYCGRKFKANLSNSGNTLSITSVSKCSSSTPSTGYRKSNSTDNGSSDNNNKEEERANILRFVLSSDKLPQFAIRALKLESSSASNFAARLGFDRIVEVVPPTVNADGTFDISKDNVVRTLLLNDNIREDVNSWSEITCNNSTSLSDLLGTYNDATPIVCSTSLSLTTSFVSKVTLQAIVTPKQVEVSLPNVISKARRILTPNTIKLSLSVEGVQYTNNNTRLAIGSFFISKGTGERKESEEASQADTPESVSKFQSVFKIDDGNSTIGGGFLSWDKYISVRTASGVYVSKTLTTSKATISLDSLKDFKSLDNFEDDNFKVFRLWFLSEEQVDNLYWDPSAGAQESPVTSSAIRTVGQYSMLLFAIVMSIMYML